jgi:hypothetical protein
MKVKGLSSAAIISSVLISACGGGGSSEPPPPVPTPPPGAPTVTVSAGIKQIRFSWPAATGVVSHYRLLRNPDGISGFTQIGTDIPSSTFAVTFDISVHREDWPHALYIVAACNSVGCTNSSTQTTIAQMVASIGYIKPSNALGAGFGSGRALALSADGMTLAVGAPLENSVGTQINGPGTQSGGFMNGAAYVYRRSANGWALEAFIKSSNNNSQHRFGDALALSGDGNTLVVGATGEGSGATGVNGDRFSTSGTWSGAAFVFVRNGTQWSEQTYLKATNTIYPMAFGTSVSISRDGSTIAVGAINESCAGAGINNTQCLPMQGAHSGAVYVYARSGNTWVAQAYVKSSNPGASDYFGSSTSLSADGAVLAVSAQGEASAASGIDGNQADNSLDQAGAVYLFTRAAGVWTQRSYIKASDPQAYALFGYAIRLNDVGDRLAATAPLVSNTTVGSGATYVLESTNGIWQQRATLRATNAATFFITPGYGVSLAFDATGDTLIVGNENEESSSVGVDGNQIGTGLIGAGAAFLYVRTGATWQLNRYIKASNTGGSDFFGSSVASSADGAVIAIGARSESSAALGVGGDQTNNQDPVSGAVYLY